MLSQEYYPRGILDKYGMVYSEPASTHTISGAVSTREEGIVGVKHVVTLKDK